MRQWRLPRQSEIMRTIESLLIAMSLVSCGPSEKAPPSPPAVKPVIEPALDKTKEIVAITRRSGTTYYEDAAGNANGLEYDLVKMFADEIGVPARFVVISELDQIPQALIEQRAHFAAAGIGALEQWQDRVVFGEPYQTVRYQVVYNNDDRKPKTIADLVGKKIEVVAGSSYVEALEQARKDFPDLSWSEVSIENSAKLLERVADGSVDFVVASSHVVDLAKNFHPDLTVAFSIGQAQSLAWAFPKGGDPEWRRRAEEFFARIQKDGTLKRLLDRYYGHVRRFGQLDLAHFREKIRTVLPGLREYFYRAEWATGIDWRLLAALGFQESHWDPKAISPTGVRGLMMLTEDTAERMKVSDRLDIKQSILGGSRYLLTLRNTLADRIPEPDRTWLALAAYNLGLGHLEDGRVLAERRNLNPDSWTDVKRVLPLLSKEEHHSTLKHGVARGGEAVVMAENVRLYYDIIKELEAPLPEREKNAESGDGGESDSAKKE